MKKSNLACFFVLVLTFFSVFDANTYKYPENLRKSAISVEKSDDSWELFTEAVIWKESRGKEDAIGDGGKAVGVLQLHPIMVKDANRILALRDISKKFSYEDRYSREKSIEIFNIIQSHYNPERDFKKACKIWNSGHPASYYNGIMKKYEELKLST